MTPASDSWCGLTKAGMTAGWYSLKPSWAAHPLIPGSYCGLGQTRAVWSCLWPRDRSKLLYGPQVLRIGSPSSRLATPQGPASLSSSPQRRPATGTLIPRRHAQYSLVKRYLESRPAAHRAWPDVCRYVSSTCVDGDGRMGVRAQQEQGCS